MFPQTRFPISCAEIKSCFLQPVALTLTNLFPELVPDEAPQSDDKHNQHCRIEEPEFYGLN